MKYILQGILVIACLFIGKSALQAQDESIHSQYVLNPIYVNTGATGFFDEHRVRFNFRKQWSGFEGSPSNYLLSYNGRVSDNDGISIMLGTQTYNAINRYRAKLAYGYNFRIKNVDIGMGLGVEYAQETLRSGALIDGMIEDGDPLIQELSDGIQYFGVDFGIYGAYKDKLTFGIGLPDLLRARLGDTVVPDSLRSATAFKSYSINLGYNFYNEETGIRVSPSIMYRNSFRYTGELDLNLLLTFLNDKLITGVSYTIGGTNSLAALLGGRIGDFSFTYGYDISFRDFQKYNGGTHELTVGITFSTRDVQKKKAETSTEK